MCAACLVLSGIHADRHQYSCGPTAGTPPPWFRNQRMDQGTSHLPGSTSGRRTQPAALGTGPRSRGRSRRPLVRRRHSTAARCWTRMRRAVQSTQRWSTSCRRHCQDWPLPERYNPAPRRNRLICVLCAADGLGGISSSTSRQRCVQLGRSSCCPTGSFEFHPRRGRTSLHQEPTSVDARRPCCQPTAAHRGV